MASALKSLSEYNSENIPSGKGLRIAIVVSEYNSDITFNLLNGCIETLTQHGVKENHIYVSYVPGAFELTYGAKIASKKNKVHAIICLGCVIKGDTDHDKYINHAVAQGITHLSLQIDRPVIFGLLTPNNHEQAVDRAGGKHGNKGVEAAVTALKMAALNK
jgi:6,7-dimethyl-8-ribityllumazine synthase